MASVDTALRRVRELLHAHGRLSSRNEALDEVGVLLFCHAMGIARDGTGITLARVSATNGKTLAEKLANHTGALVQAALPISLAHEMSAADFTLRLKPGETDLAERLIDVFERLELGTGGDPLQVDVVNEAFGRFLADSFIDEKELGQYLTPPEVVDFMARLACSVLDDDERLALLAIDRERFGYVLDPSCGVGSFLAEFIRVAHQSLVVPSADAEVAADWPARATRSLVVGIDKAERMVRLALANLALFGASAASLHLANSLASRGNDGTLARSLFGKVGLILTNPPFGATFPAADVDTYRIATTWPGRAPASVDSELLFLERYLQWLRPGGQLLAIVPDSILTNKGLFADLRRGLAGDVTLHTVVSLPSVAFAAAGTTTKTSVLHLRKADPGAARPSRPTRFAICNSLGYAVSTRGSHRTKVADGRNELPDLLRALSGAGSAGRIREVAAAADAARWDATHHASMSEAVRNRLGETGLRVDDCALLVNERVDPRRFAEPTFRYIEISDVDGRAQTVGFKNVGTAVAPGRARLQVRSDDVLVSTVRPERRTVGVVPPWLDGAVCTTGFAVLRPKGIDSLLLAALLRTDFVLEQLMRNNVGIAYPAIEPACLPEVLLPISAADVARLSSAGLAVAELRSALFAAKQEFDTALRGACTAWLQEMPDSGRV